MTMPTVTGDTGDTNASPEVNTLELLTFRCGGQRYAIDIMDVREIRGWSEPTPLPHAPAFLRGMVNLRGTVLPVTDLAQRLGLPATADDPRNVIIVVQSGRRVHGLLVEAVSDIVHPSADQLQDLPDTGLHANSLAERLFVVDETMVQILSTTRTLPTLDMPIVGTAA